VRAFLLPLLLLVTACGRVGYDPLPVAGFDDGGRRARPVPTSDGGPPAQEVGGPDAGPDGGARDGGPETEADPASDMDGGGPPRPAPCGDSLAGTLALWTFDDPTDLGQEAGGRFPGTVLGSPGTGDGPSGCGGALALPGRVDDLLLVPDDPAWDLTEGSVDLWLRAERCGSDPRWDTGDEAMGILSRASRSPRRGHVTVGWTPACQVVVRARVGEDASPAGYRSPSLPEEEWHHLGLSFAPDLGLVFWLNGERVAWVGGDVGLAGNDEPWVVGASAERSAAGESAPRVDPFQGRVDHLRITDRPQDFTR